MGERQQYEEYWKITLAFSDIHGMKFRNTLDVILRFIDDNDLINKEYDKANYERLQIAVQKIANIDMASVRKAINQYVKLGFIYPLLKGYHPLAHSFLRATDDETRQIIFSKILYSNAHFSASISKEVENIEFNEINFFMKTLMYSGPLYDEDLVAIMKMDITTKKRDFLTREELDSLKEFVKTIEFEKRKYNQINYLKNILRDLAEVVYDKKNGIFYFNDDDLVVDIEEDKRKKRDPYLHKLYKKGLIDESKKVYGNEIRCFLEKLPYKSMVASHIKPFKISSYEEEYNSSNGLLLCQNVDAYFDKFDISFTDEGKILFGKKVHKEIVEHYKDMKLDKEILTPERLEFLKYHREHFNEKNK